MNNPRFIKTLTVMEPEPLRVYLNIPKDSKTYGGWGSSCPNSEILIPNLQVKLDCQSHGLQTCGTNEDQSTPTFQTAPGYGHIIRCFFTSAKKKRSFLKRASKKKHSNRYTPEQ